MSAGLHRIAVESRAALAAAARAYEAEPSPANRRRLAAVAERIAARLTRATRGPTPLG